MKKLLPFLLSAVFLLFINLSSCNGEPDCRTCYTCQDVQYRYDAAKDSFYLYHLINKIHWQHDSTKACDSAAALTPTCTLIK